MSFLERKVKIMAKSIITQNGTIINYSKLLAVYVDEDLDDNENVLGFELVGVTGTEKNSEGIVLGSFADEQSAENAKDDLIRWLQSEAFSTFKMPTANESGDQ